MVISGIVRGQNSNYARIKRNKVMAGLDEQFLSMGRWLTGSAEVPGSNPTSPTMSLMHCSSAGSL